MKWKLLGHVQLFATPWTVACQAPLSMEFSRQEYWSGLPCPSPGDLPNPGIESRSPTLLAYSLPTALSPKLAKASYHHITYLSIKGLIFVPEGNWAPVRARSWWWTGRPHVLQSMGSQRVRHDWATELNWELGCSLFVYSHHHSWTEPRNSWTWWKCSKLWVQGQILDLSTDYIRW